MKKKKYAPQEASSDSSGLLRVVRAVAQAWVFNRGWILEIKNLFKNIKKKNLYRETKIRF